MQQMCTYVFSFSFIIQLCTNGRWGCRSRGWWRRTGDYWYLGSQNPCLTSPHCARATPPDHFAWCSYIAGKETCPAPWRFSIKGVALVAEPSIFCVSILVFWCFYLFILFFS